MANKKEYLLAKGNHKLCNAVGIWNLPTKITCPGATSLCKEGGEFKDKVTGKMVKVKCYSQAQETRYPACPPCRMTHLSIAKLPNFASLLSLEILQRKFKMVRFHEGGDIFSQAYLNQLYEVCRTCPDTQFWMYTKSFALYDFSNKPDNLVIYISLDRTTPKEAYEKRHPALLNAPTAYLMCPDETLQVNNLTCNKGGKEEKYCGDTCKICVEGKSSVYFDAH